MRFLLDLLFPPKCILCHKLLYSSKTDLCDPCALEVLKQSPQILRGKHFAKCVAPFAYEGKVRASIHRYKFGGRKFYVKTYSAWLAACIQSELAGEFDLITYIPISRRRLRCRGYDQSALLAKTLAKILGMPMIPCLKKIKNNTAQSSILDAERRKKNVAGVYCALLTEDITQKRILLIDDIITTGATLEEGSKILQKAGAKSVVCAALAMTK